MRPMATERKSQRADLLRPGDPGESIRLLLDPLAADDRARASLARRKAAAQQNMDLTIANTYLLVAKARAASRRKETS